MPMHGAVPTTVSNKINPISNGSFGAQSVHEAESLPLDQGPRRPCCPKYPRPKYTRYGENGHVEVDCWTKPLEKCRVMSESQTERKNDKTEAKYAMSVLQRSERSTVPSASHWYLA